MLFRLKVIGNYIIFEKIVSDFVKISILHVFFSVFLNNKYE